MKATLLLSIQFFSIISYGQGSSNEEIIRRYLRAGLNGKWEEMKNLMNDSIIDYHPTVLEPPAKGSENLISSWKSSMQPFTKMSFNLLGSGSVEITTGELKGKWIFDAREVFGEVSGKDQPIKFQMVGLYKVENDQVYEVHNFGNLMDIYIQFGYQVVPPKE